MTSKNMKVSQDFTRLNRYGNQREFCCPASQRAEVSICRLPAHELKHMHEYGLVCRVSGGLDQKADGAQPR